MVIIPLPVLVHTTVLLDCPKMEKPELISRGARAYQTADSLSSSALIDIHIQPLSSSTVLRYLHDLFIYTATKPANSFGPEMILLEVSTTSKLNSIPRLIWT